MGGRSIEKLSTAKVRSLKTPGRYGDGGGLWLQVRDAEHRSWMFRYSLHGRARWMGLGHVRDVTLAEAREKARDCRRLLLDGIDPLAQREARKAEAAAAAGAVVTFQQAAERYIAAHKAGWKNEKHGAQWEATLAAYAYPALGKLSVAAVDTGAVVKALEPIWTAKPETASRVRGRIERVLDWAKARGYRKGDNPARWRGHLDNLLPRASKVKRVTHHAAMPWKDVPQFMVDLRAQDGIGARALEFTVLTAARTGEVIGATWSEIDLAEKVWTVPAERMKAGKEQRVPLAPRVVEILEDMQQQGDSRASAPVFPGGRKGKPLSNMAMAATLKRMEVDCTVHGFRSSFRDWAGESTGFAREIIEHALAHQLKDKAEAAYQRGDLLAKRRKLMEAWARYCEKPGEAAKVVPMERRA